MLSMKFNQALFKNSLWTFYSFNRLSPIRCEQIIHTKLLFYYSTKAVVINNDEREIDQLLKNKNVTYSQKVAKLKDIFQASDISNLSMQYLLNIGMSLINNKIFENDILYLISTSVLRSSAEFTLNKDLVNFYKLILDISNEFTYNRILYKFFKSLTEKIDEIPIEHLPSILHVTFLHYSKLSSIQFNENTIACNKLVNLLSDEIVLNIDSYNFQEISQVFLIYSQPEALQSHISGQLMQLLENFLTKTLKSKEDISDELLILIVSNLKFYVKQLDDSLLEQFIFWLESKNIIPSFSSKALNSFIEFFSQVVPAKGIYDKTNSLLMELKKEALLRKKRIPYSNFLNAVCNRNLNINETQIINSIFVLSAHNLNPTHEYCFKSLRYTKEKYVEQICNTIDNSSFQISNLKLLSELLYALNFYSETLTKCMLAKMSLIMEKYNLNNLHMISAIQALHYMIAMGFYISGKTYPVIQQTVLQGEHNLAGKLNIDFLKLLMEWKLENPKVKINFRPYILSIKYQRLGLSVKEQVFLASSLIYLHQQKIINTNVIDKMLIYLERMINQVADKTFNETKGESKNILIKIEKNESLAVQEKEKKMNSNYKNITVLDLNTAILLQISNLTKK